MRNQVSLRRRRAFRLSVLKFGAIALLALLVLPVTAAAADGAAFQDDPVPAMAAVPFLALGGLMFREADKGPTGGGPAADNPPEPEGDSLEAKLSSAKGFIAKFFGELATAKAETVRLQGQFDAATSTATGIQATLDSTKAELAAAQGTITKLTGERDGFKSQLSLAQGNITRLESLCQLKGIDPNQAVTAPAGPAPAMSTAEEWQTKLAAAKGNDAQMKVLEEFQAAVKAGTVKPAESA